MLVYMLTIRLTRKCFWDQDVSVVCCMKEINPTEEWELVKNFWVLLGSLTDRL